MNDQPKTTAELLNYWKAQSRKYEALAKSREDYDALKAELDQLQQQRAAITLERQRAARDAGLTEGRNAVLADGIDVLIDAIATPERAALLKRVINRDALIVDGHIDTDALSILAS